MVTKSKKKTEGHAKNVSYRPGFSLFLISMDTLVNEYFKSSRLKQRKSLGQCEEGLSSLQVVQNWPQVFRIRLFFSLK